MRCKVFLWDGDDDGLGLHMMSSCLVLWIYYVNEWER